MHDEPTIAMCIEPSVSGEPGSARVRIGITWPNGHYSEWSGEASPPARVGVDVEDLFTAAGQLFVVSGEEVGREPGAAMRALAESGRVPPYNDKIDPLGKREKRMGATEGIMQSKGIIESAITYYKRAGVKLGGGDQTALLKAYWEQHVKPGTSLGDKLGDIAKIAAPILATAIPIVGPVLGPALGLAAAAKAVVDVAKKAAPAAEAVKAVKKKVDASAAAAAKAKAIANTAQALSSPTTAAALAKAGVPVAQTKAAANLFAGVRNAAASIAATKKGDAAQAAKFAAAAATNAAAAKVPASKVNDSGRKLYYLAIVPPE